MKKSRTPIIHKHFPVASLGIAVLVLLGALAISVTTVFIWYKFQPAAVAEKDIEGVRYGVSKELNSLSAEIDRERMARGTFSVKATDLDGVVLVRSQVLNVLGDNAFVNTAIGRQMTQLDRTIASVEAGGLDPRNLIFSSGRFVRQEKERVGAIFTTQLVDNNYALTFRDLYLSSDTQIAFYTKDHGLSGTSITRPEGLKLITRFVRPELDVIREEHGRRLIHLADGRFFIVQNMWLPGSEESVGGVLVFTPLKHAYAIAAISFILPIFIFLVIAYLLRASLHRRGRSFHWFHETVVGCLIVYCVSAVLCAVSFYTFVPTLTPQEYPLYNSIMRFQPEGGVFDSRFEQRVSVVLDSGGESISAIRLSLNYDPEALSVQSVDMERSICRYFIINEHNSQTGHIDMECIIPKPGFNGNSAIVADLFFKPRNSVAQTSIRFSEESRVLADDGLATDVLRMTVDSTLRFSDVSTQGTQKSLTVFSPTHPNPERWYSRQNIYLSWVPTLTSTEGIPPLKKQVLSDGIHNFTVKAKNSAGEEISGALKVRVDTTPPEELTLLASETRIKPGGLVRFTASGKDSLSGLQRVFYLKINDEIFFPIGTEIHIPFPKAGTYTITLRAYDQAGNHRDVSQKIFVKRYQ